MRTPISHWLLGAILCVQVMSFYISWQQDDPDIVYPQDSQIFTRERPPQATQPDREKIADLVRSILQEELAIAVQKYQTAAQQPATSRPVIDAAQNQEAARKSGVIVDNALASGKWQQDDNLAIMQLAVNLTSEQRIALLDKLSDAINDGGLELEATPPPL